MEIVFFLPREFIELSTYIHFITLIKNLNHPYFRYTAAEKQMKMETLKEERQVVRAMRETAELNKIIAEQKLKHVLWAKQQEMAYV